MKRRNFQQDKPIPKHPLGSSILDKWWDENLQRRFFTDGFRTLSLIPGKKVRSG